MNKSEFRSLDTISKSSYVLGLVCGFWLVFYPKPYRLAVIINIIVPIIAIVTEFIIKTYIKKGKLKLSNAPSALPAIVLPSIALGYSALSYNIIYTYLFWICMIFISFFICGLLFISACKDSKIKDIKLDVFLFAILLIIVALPYSYGLLVQTNCLLDKSSITANEASVLNKICNDGRYSTSYYLKVYPNPIFISKQKIRVSKYIYYNVNVGDNVNVSLKNGALGFQWFGVFGK